jgi:aryl-alcohol dehydrogenase-like predicted oxidoreductase
MEPRRHVLGPVTVSRIGFGAMQLPGPGVFGPPRDRTAAMAVLRRAVELGVDHIDTAQYYGPGVANELIRTALHPYPAGLALVSKVGARLDASGGVLRYDRPAELRQGIEDNLRSLAVDRLTVVNLRLVDDAPPGQYFDDQIAAMVAARPPPPRAGCHRHRLRPEPAEPGRSAVHARTRGVPRPRHRFRAVLPARLGLRPRRQPGPGEPSGCGTAVRLRCTPAQVALAWLLDLRPEVLLIPGTSSISHLEENMAVADIGLDSEARDLLG